MKRKLGWFGLGFAGAELAAAILPPLVCVPAAAFLVCLALLWIKRRRDSAIPVLGALCGLAWFLVFTLVWVRPVKARAGQTVTCTAVVETDADASYSESRLRGTLRLTEIDGRAANVKVQCASFPGESAGERFTAKFALTELPDNKYRLSRQSKGVYLQAEYLGSYHPLDASRAPRFALYRLRQRWSATLRRWLPRQLDGIEAAMLLADKSRLDDSVQQAFRTAGVSHLLAVSGLHLALLCGLFLWASVFSGALSLGREAVSGYQLFSANAVAAGDWIRENTDRDDVFLTGQQHINPVCSLAGRQIICGSDLYVFFHGLDYSQQSADCRRFYEDPRENADVLETYNVHYIYVSDYERAEFDVDLYALDEAYELIYANDDVRIYDAGWGETP